VGTIQFAFKAPGLAAEAGWEGVATQYALAFIDPFGTLWFIYLLPVFFVVTKATRDVPPMIVWFVAALLQIAQVHTGATVIDEFCARFVYLYSGYVLAPYVFRFAATVAVNKRDAIRLLVTWALFEALMVFGGYSTFPVVGLGLGRDRAFEPPLHPRLGAALALRRAALDRDLSRLLLADGGDAGVAAETCAQSRPRARGADGHGSCRDHAAAVLRRGERHLLALPVQAAGLGAARTPASPRTGGVNPISARFA
jgi:hypothetical protein